MNLVIGLRFSHKIYIIRDILRQKRYQCCKKPNKANVFYLKCRLSPPQYTCSYKLAHICSVNPIQRIRGRERQKAGKILRKSCYFNQRYFSFVLQSVY